MMSTKPIFYTFTKIGHFVQAVASRNRQKSKEEENDPQKEKEKEKEITSFTGSVKLHGTNGGIVCKLDTPNEWYVQSRGHVLDETHENLGFREWCLKRRPDTIPNMMQKMSNAAFQQLSGEFPDHKHDMSKYTIVAYGEFCGRAIQKSVAISKLKNGRRIFVIFAVALIHQVPLIVHPADPSLGGIGQHHDHENTWLRIDYPQCRELIKLGDDGIFNVFDFPTFSVDVDWSSHESRHAALSDMKKYTDQVAAECPVAKQLENISGLGEGIVWAARGGKNYAIGKKFASLMFKTKSSKFDDTVRKHQISDEPEISPDMTSFIQKVATSKKFAQAWTESRTDFERKVQKTDDREAILTRSKKDLDGFSPPLSNGFSPPLLLAGDEKKDDDALQRQRRGAFCLWFAKDVLAEQSEEIKASMFLPKQIKNELYHAAEREFDSFPQKYKL